MGVGIKVMGDSERNDSIQVGKLRVHVHVHVPVQQLVTCTQEHKIRRNTVFERLLILFVVVYIHWNQPDFGLGGLGTYGLGGIGN